jgi:hypothetical protein
VANIAFYIGRLGNNFITGNGGGAAGCLLFKNNTWELYERYGMHICKEFFWKLYERYAYLKGISMEIV